MPTKRSFGIPALVAGAMLICTLAGCDLFNNLNLMGSKWPDNDTLSKWGLDGLGEPTDASNIIYTEMGGLFIIFDGTQNTADDILDYFSVTAGWNPEVPPQTDSGIWENGEFQASFLYDSSTNSCTLISKEPD